MYIDLTGLFKYFNSNLFLKSHVPEVSKMEVSLLVNLFRKFCTCSFCAVVSPAFVRSLRLKHLQEFHILKLL